MSVVEPRFEDDADGIFREAFVELQGKEKGDFDARCARRRFFEEPAWQPSHAGRRS